VNREEKDEGEVLRRRVVIGVLLYFAVFYTVFGLYILGKIHRLPEPSFKPVALTGILNSLIIIPMFRIFDRFEHRAFTLPFGAAIILWAVHLFLIFWFLNH
jgi:hypothetical protein